MDDYKARMFDAFDPVKENWLNYSERLENHFTIAKTEDNMKTATLINCIGAEPYAILKDIFAPEKPATKDFKDVVKALTDYYIPATMKWTERYKMNNRDQKVGETCNEFAAALRGMAKHCMYGHTWMRPSHCALYAAFVARVYGKGCCFPKRKRSKK